ncbi:NYN domain-containing protein [Rothia sp. AR01]|uniref:NYN domain-containing protein n=1 Tax=Rothia santali TaxID=2949643 RepID=A0A9X2KLN0_9MICC|nr:NYN domain-containing protein [Rothia santali]MCP3426341.1 NYN domain-containing protein [Rothia santali]
MTESADGRVAVYIDFDNIVISRYDQVHGRNQYQRDKSKGLSATDAGEEVAERLARATVDIGAVIDYASSFGTLVLTRAYADWSTPMNADYRGQLVGRSVDLVQLFPAAAYGKNGADIRLAVDAVEDMFRLPDLTHVVVVAGDSDYIALAQRCKRLGRYVIGVGVAGSTARSLTAACDEFSTYDALPGVEPVPPATAKQRKADEAEARDSETDSKESEADAASGASKRRRGRGRKAETPARADSTAAAEAAAEATSEADAAEAAAEPERDAAEERQAPRRRGSRRAQAPATMLVEEEPEDSEDPQEVASVLLEYALRLCHDRDDSDWLHSSQVKTQLKRLDPSFSEKSLGYRSFSDFIKSRPEIVEIDESSTARMVRLI